jgi:hypothetical protein
MWNHDKMGRPGCLELAIWIIVWNLFHNKPSWHKIAQLSAFAANELAATRYSKMTKRQV